MSDPRFQAVSDLLGDWRDDVLSGTPPTLYPIGDGDLARIEIGPGLVTLIGGAPAAGKTGLVMQSVFEALDRTPTLRALVLNVEMSPSVLLDRQLARLSGVDLSTIRHRRLDASHAEAIDRGMATLEQLGERLAFVRPPFDLANVAASADVFGAELVVLDYIQRIAGPGENGDRRGAFDATMGYIRQFADAGTAIIVVAALSRSKDSKGRSSYSGEALSLASFRETSELEYGADDAFILAPIDDADGEGEVVSRVVLKHLKSRHGEARDIALQFDRPRQRFTPAESAGATENGSHRDGRLQAALRSMWNALRPGDGGGDP